MTTLTPEAARVVLPSQRQSVPIKSINLKNLFSFSPAGLGDEDGLELLPLNILIGPNGVGKSNFIDAIGLLQAAASDLTYPFSEVDSGVGEWIWHHASFSREAKIEVIINYPAGVADDDNDLLRYWLKFEEGGVHDLMVTGERLENKVAAASHYDHPFQYLLYDEQHRAPMLVRRTEIGANRRQLRREDIEAQQSVLSRRWDAELYPEITYVSQLFNSFRLYRDWSFGRSSPVRRPRRILNASFLDESADNLAGVIASLLNNPQVEPKLLEYLENFDRDATNLEVADIDSYQVLRLKEKGMVHSASRLSDGTLRWFALLAVLLHPEPPKLICLEEPEIGMHPDMMPLLASLLRQAARRTQLIVTTHSESLVDQFTSEPESVVVCEKRDGATKLRRLDGRKLANWLKEYSLGQLWSMDITGGNH